MSREISEQQLPPLSHPEPVVPERAESPITLGDLECAVCTEQYSDVPNQQPRTLACGHTICTSCIASLIINRRSEADFVLCPICRGNFDVDSAEDIPVSFSLLNLASVIKNEYKLSKRSDASEQSINSFGICDIHNSPKQFWCLSCNVWICGMCAVADHKESSANCCSVCSVYEVMSIRKKLHNEEHKKLLERKKLKLISLAQACDACKAATDMTSSLIEKLEESLKIEKNRIKNLHLVNQTVEEVSSTINGEILLLSTLSDTIESSSIYTDLIKTMQDYQNTTFQNSSAKKFIKFPSQTWTTHLISGCLEEHQHNIFAEEILNSRNYYFKVSVNGRINIHSSKKDHCLPQGSIIFQISDILKEPCALFFMDLCFSSDVQIRLNISLLTILSEHVCSFSSLALGRFGNSYSGKTFSNLEVDPTNAATIMWSGCVTVNGAAESLDTENLSTKYKYFDAGTIFVPRNAANQTLCSNFGVLLNSSFVKFSKRLIEIGTVENDLQLFKDILTHENIKHLKIVDCGCTLIVENRL